MKKAWYIKKSRMCSINGENCGDAVSGYKEDLSIDCSDCPDYIEYKNSGMSLEKYAEKIREEYEA